jgi:hypothetical protein
MPAKAGIHDFPQVSTRFLKPSLQARLTGRGNPFF